MDADDKTMAMDADDAAADQVLQRYATQSFAAVDVLENRLGVKPGFLRALKEDPSDWSFLVRLTVFIQAALAHTVARKLGQPELEDYCARMNLNARHGGLVALAQQLGIASKRDVAYIDALSELRNRYAHRLENINRPLPAYLLSLPPQDFRKFVGSMLITVGAKSWFDTAGSSVRSALAQQARTGIWMNAIGLCSKLSEFATDAEAHNARRLLRETRQAARGALFEALRGPLGTDVREGQPDEDGRDGG